jgi:hypothetical protein
MGYRFGGNRASSVSGLKPNQQFVVGCFESYSGTGAANLGRSHVPVERNGNIQPATPEKVGFLCSDNGN